MVKRCVIEDCTLESELSQLLPFPKNLVLLNQWISKLPLLNFTSLNFNTAEICEHHFNPKDLKDGPGFVKELVYNAVPEHFPSPIEVNIESCRFCLRKITGKKLMIDDLFGLNYFNLMQEELSSDFMQSTACESCYIMIMSCSQIKSKIQENQTLLVSLSQPELPGVKETVLESDEEFLLSEVRLILNKLTPKNFSVLGNRIKTLNFRKSEELDGCTMLVFEKAISEPNLTNACAKMCKEISNLFVTGGDGKKMTFKNKLINQCQEEFYRHREDLEFRNRGLNVKKIETETSKEKEDELKANFEGEECKIRKRAVGTIQFIGELYKIDMLTSTIIKFCINVLLDDDVISEISLECLCKLLTIVGLKIEKRDQRKVDLSDYMRRLRDIVHKYPEIDSRIRSMIQDVLDLRSNNWLSKTIKEVKTDQLSNQNSNQPARQRRGNWRDRHNRRGSQHGNYGNKQIAQQEKSNWSTHQNYKGRERPSNHTNSGDCNNNQKPQKASSQQSSANQLSSQKTQETEKINNKSAHYRRGWRNKRGNQGKPVNKPTTQKNGNSSTQQSNKGRQQSSKVESITSSSCNDQQSQSQQSLEKQPLVESNSSSTQQVEHPMSHEEVTEMFEEFRKIVDNYREGHYTLDESKEKFKLLRINDEVLIEIYKLNLNDRTVKERISLTELLWETIQSKIISHEDNVKALKGIFDLGKNLLCDLQNVYLFIAQYLDMPLKKGFLTMKDILFIMESECEAGGADDMLQKLFVSIETNFGKKTLYEVFESSNVDIKLFLSNKNVKEFVEKNKFEYLLSKEKPKISDVNDISNQITSLLKNNTDIDEIFDWINTNVESTSDYQFIRALTTTIIEHCIEKQADLTLKLNEDLLSKLLPLLQRYINNEDALELQALYAIQKLIVRLEHPQGVLTSIFSELYDNDVLSSDGFKKWQDSKDPQEQFGKGVILKNCTQFFIMLSEQGESSCDED